MKLVRKPALLTLALPLLTGCIPEKRILWSPDGSKAAVCGDRGLFFIDGDGHVLPPRLEGTAARAAWFRDGRHLAVVHFKEEKKWADVAPIFTPAQVETIKAASEVFRRRVLEHQGSWDKFEIDPEGRLSAGDELAVVLYTRDLHAEGLAQKLGKEWNELEKVAARIWQLQVFELAGDRLVAGPVLARTLDELRQPHVAPDDRNITFVSTGPEADGELVLCIVAVQGGEVRQVARGVALETDWSPDGRSLAYIYSTSRPSKNESTVQLGSLTTVRVADAQGALLSEFAERNDRVGLLFNPLLQVNWLSDGRLLFSSVEVTLPATTRDMPQQWTLFVLDPRMPASVSRVLARDFPEPLDTGCPMFELSPDESQVLLSGPKGRVYLYDFAAGKTTVVQSDEDAQGKLRSLPSWRTQSELTCVVPRSSSDKTGSPARVVLWQAGKVRELSESWTEAMREGWLSGN